MFSPSSTSKALADAIHISSGDVVLDVGCGSGVLGFVALLLGAGRVYGCDVSEEAVAVASENARRLGLQDRSEFRAGSLLDPFPDVSADVIIGDVSGIPDALAAASGWFPDGRGGGPTGVELPLAMLEDAAGRLRPGGRLYLPTGTLQDEGRLVSRARAIFGEDRVEAVAERHFPLPDHLARSEAAAAMLARHPPAFVKKGSRLVWRLWIWCCTRI